MSTNNDMTPQEISELYTNDKFVDFYSLLATSDEFKVGKFLLFRGLTDDSKFEEIQFHFPCLAGDKEYFVMSLDSFNRDIPFRIIKMLQECYVEAVTGTICN